MKKRKRVIIKEIRRKVTEKKKALINGLKKMMKLMAQSLLSLRCKWERERKKHFLCLWDSKVKWHIGSKLSWQWQHTLGLVGLNRRTFLWEHFYNYIEVSPWLFYNYIEVSPDFFIFILKSHHLYWSHFLYFYWSQNLHNNSSGSTKRLMLLILIWKSERKASAYTFFTPFSI